MTPASGTTHVGPSRWGWALATFAAGAILAGQSRINGELAVHLGYGLDAALWSFGSGLVVLTMLVVVSRRVRAGFSRLRTAIQRKEIRVWQCLGGMVGGLYVFGQGYAVPIIGVALFTIAVVGALMTLQQATNGRVGIASGHPMTTTWINFATGAALLLVLCVPAALTGAVGTPVSTQAPWWSWLGGLVGIVVVAVSAVAVRHLGVLQVMILMLLGQPVAAVGLDALLPATRGHLTPVVVLGLGVTLLAAVLAARASRRQDPTPRSRPAA